MSYEIEKAKGVFTVRIPEEQKERFLSYGHESLEVFAIQSASNNVVPRRFYWNAVATDSVSIWGGRPMLPSTIWALAKDADGGGVKPQGRNCSGTAYIKQWQEAVKNRRAWDGSLREISVWEAGGKKLPLSDLFSLAPDAPQWCDFASRRPCVHAAFHALFRNHIGPRTNLRQFISPNTSLFFDAVFLFHVRRDLPFSVNLCG